VRVRGAGFGKGRVDDGYEELWDFVVRVCSDVLVDEVSNREGKERLPFSHANLTRKIVFSRLDAVEI
jgi:hypothetical protein